MFKIRTFGLGLVLTAALAFAAAADEAKTTDKSDPNFTLDQATDNFVEDAGKVGDKAEEVGDDIAKEAEDAYDSTKKAVEEATE